MSSDRPLFKAAPPPEVEPTAAVHVAHAFIQRCRAWATERELPKRRAAAAVADDPAVVAKLHGWLTYVQFLEHTLKELEDGTLDHWFDPSASPSGGASTEGPV